MKIVMFRLKLEEKNEKNYRKSRTLSSSQATEEIEL